MGRNILFITTDQQRYDSLGCNGGTIARNPVVDGLASEGINFRGAYCNSTVCTPARSTILTGQYIRTHGAIANGVPLPVDAPSVAAYLGERAGYRTALLGKAHFEPGLDLQADYQETQLGRSGETGPMRGFEHVELVMHGALPPLHYSRWLQEHHPEHMGSYVRVLSAERGGDTGMIETKNNPIPRAWYHTDWVADRTVAYLDGLAADDDWFVWMSFPDPHHPWDPPAEELHRVDWHDLPLPAGHPGSDEAVRSVLERKPAHWLACWEGRFINQEGGPASYRPARVTDDQFREINAKTHVMNELIDEACGRVLDRVAARGWTDRTDVFFTTDHGELQGDLGLLFKGPFHVESLMHIPLVWRPAPGAAVSADEVNEPVGQVDLAPTFCQIAGVSPPDWMQGAALPRAGGSDRERALCEWDSQFPGYGMHLRSIVRDGWLCTAYEPTTRNQPNGLERWFANLPPQVRELLGVDDNPMGPQSPIDYDGTEGELYNLADDPHQFENLWDDPNHRSTRRDLVADLYDSLPEPRPEPLLVARPA